MPFPTQPLPALPTVTAPDGSDVRVLASGRRGSMAHFTLAPGAVARAVVHRSVKEIWYFLAGQGRMWRAREDEERFTSLHGGVSLTIPVSTRFQYRNDGQVPLVAVAVTMPPWPGPDEAEPVEGPWTLQL